MRTRVPVARQLIATLLIALLTGCHSWQPTTVSPRTVILEELPSGVRFRLPDGDTMIVMDPLMRNDSILSTEAGTVPIALQDVSGLEVRRFSTRKTIVFAAGILGVMIGWTRWATNRSGGVDPGEPSVPKVPVPGG
ncbi:MAG: hypothetical protein OSB36_04115 [Longimicrobiales bacterium]|jgi:hypothetical protein|nr:hypothetical protein [Longimicrobiales bacterium]